MRSTKLCQLPTSRLAGRRMPRRTSALVLLLLATILITSLLSTSCSAEPIKNETSSSVNDPSSEDSPSAKYREPWRFPSNSTTPPSFPSSSPPLTPTINQTSTIPASTTRHSSPIFANVSNNNTVEPAAADIEKVSSTSSSNVTTTTDPRTSVRPSAVVNETAGDTTKSVDSKRINQSAASESAQQQQLIAGEGRLAGKAPDFPSNASLITSTAVVAEVLTMPHPDSKIETTGNSSSTDKSSAAKRTVEDTIIEVKETSGEPSLLESNMESSAAAKVDSVQKAASGIAPLLRLTPAAAVTTSEQDVVLSKEVEQLSASVGPVENREDAEVEEVHPEKSDVESSSVASGMAPSSAVVPSDQSVEKISSPGNSSNGEPNSLDFLKAEPEVKSSFVMAEDKGGNGNVTEEGAIMSSEPAVTAGVPRDSTTAGPFPDNPRSRYRLIDEIQTEQMSVSVSSAELPSAVLQTSTTTLPASTTPESTTELTAIARTATPGQQREEVTGNPDASEATTTATSPLPGTDNPRSRYRFMDDTPEEPLPTFGGPVATQIAHTTPTTLLVPSARTTQQPLTSTMDQTATTTPLTTLPPPAEAPGSRFRFIGGPQPGVRPTATNGVSQIDASVANVAQIIASLSEKTEDAVRFSTVQPWVAASTSAAPVEASSVHLTTPAHLASTASSLPPAQAVVDGSQVKANQETSTAPSTPPTSAERSPDGETNPDVTSPPLPSGAPLPPQATSNVNHQTAANVSLFDGRQESSSVPTTTSAEVHHVESVTTSPPPATLPPQRTVPGGQEAAANVSAIDRRQPAEVSTITHATPLPTTVEPPAVTPSASARVTATLFHHPATLAVHQTERGLLVPAPTTTTPSLPPPQTTPPSTPEPSPAFPYAQNHLQLLPQQVNLLRLQLIQQEQLKAYQAALMLQRLGMAERFRKFMLSPEGMKLTLAASRNPSAFFRILSPRIKAASMGISADSASPSTSKVRKIAVPDPAACITRLTDASFGQREYHFSWRHSSNRKMFDWFDARNYCRRHCMEPVSPGTPEENSFIKGVLLAARMAEGVDSTWTSGRLCNTPACAPMLKSPVLASVTWVWAATKKLIPPSSEIGFQDWAPVSREPEWVDTNCLAIMSPSARRPDGDSTWRWTRVPCSGTFQHVICVDSPQLEARIPADVGMILRERKTDATRLQESLSRAQLAYF